MYILEPATCFRRFSTVTCLALTTLATTVGCDRIDPELLAEFAKSGKGHGTSDQAPQPQLPPLAGSGDFAWESGSFEYPRDTESCDGAQFVRFDKQHNLFVGVVTCDNQGLLRLYLSPKRDQPFVPTADRAGHGQDQCELVNPAFRLTNEDDINSGGCESCTTGNNIPLEGVETYSRFYFGQEFEHVDRSPQWFHQASRLNCGVVLEGQAPSVAEAAIVEMDCATDAGYSTTGFANAPEQQATLKSPEVHVLGVYETRSDHGFDRHPTGKATVKFARSAPSVLVLSAYEPTEWDVQLAPGAQLQKIVLSGYHEQSVTFSGDINTEIHTVQAGDDAPYAYAIPSDNAARLLRFAAERGGAQPLSFHGCYRATTFSVR